MKRKDKWPDDPVVREVREARAKLWKEGGGTFEGYMKVVNEHADRLLAEQKPKRRAKRK